MRALLPAVLSSLEENAFSVPEIRSQREANRQAEAKGAKRLAEDAQRREEETQRTSAEAVEAQHREAKRKLTFRTASKP